MLIKELRQKSEGELQKQLKLLREQWRELRFKVASKQHKDVRDVRDIKKDIARTLTVLKEKELLKKFRNIKTTKPI